VRGRRMANEEAIIEYIKSWMDEGDGRFFFSQEDADTIIKALEKQIPKKPIVDERYVKCICPKCWALLTDYQSLCDNCGQKLRWE